MWDEDNVQLSGRFMVGLAGEIHSHSYVKYDSMKVVKLYNVLV
jgi:hypothetical protein